MFPVHMKTERRRFQMSSSLKDVFKKLPFCVRLVCTVGLTDEMKLRFQISPA